MQPLLRQEQSHHNHSDEGKNDNKSHLHLSAYSSPPHSLSTSKDLSSPLYSLSISSDFSNHTCHSRENSFIDDTLSITSLHNLPPSASPLILVAANCAQPSEPIFVTKVDTEI
ncbi:CASP-like protein 4A1 [Cucumis melo var. makuwa]|uniref:CASP-like protein 4A1 n=1 Tax=Cucumis melo var. makuwa TaxID=1194695 RepID=A0A5A7SNL3_CUCMM|nr:CASP-like protein 4A1 [Cucumis melo var. makuwa]